MRFGPGPHLKGRNLFTGIDPSAYDYIHELIIHQEISRCGLRGFMNGLFSGALIGVPPLLHFSNDKELGERVSNEVLDGKKWLCLAISEAFAGSDVAGIRCTAKKSEDGKFWIVNGTKKWITNGMYSDYFTVSVAGFRSELVSPVTRRPICFDSRLLAELVLCEYSPLLRFCRI